MALWTGFLNNEESKSCLSSCKTSTGPLHPYQIWMHSIEEYFEKKVNQKVNLGWRPTPARLPAWCPTCPDIAILKDKFFKNPSKNAK